MPKINRRKFFSRFGSGTIAFGAIGLSKRKLFGSTTGFFNENSEPKIIKYNKLGKTGLKVSDISFGGSDVFSENVVRYAFDLGVNLFDTAENYQKGKSEEIIGKGLKGVREKAYIITKHSFHRRYPPQKISDIIERIEGSLRRLQTDYIDILFPYHGINNPTLIKNDLVMEATEKLKKQGKIRFTGFSTHNAVVTLAECIKPEYSSFIQVALFIYNHIEGAKIEHLVKKLHHTGIGTIAMKSQAGGKQGTIMEFVDKKQTYEIAALKWNLSNPAIDSTTISMKTFSHIELYLKASGQRLQKSDTVVLNEYRKKVDNLYCRMECNICEAFCPKNVAISDIMRYAMYFEDYQQEKKAIQEYANLKTGNKPVSCQTCIGYCNNACPYHLQVKEKLIKTHDFLS